LLAVSIIGFAPLVACYHATIDTGLAPSNQVIEKPWASGWVYGLVPPDPVETMSKCPNGVSRVETQLSFANQLVDILTLGIYTPMEIKVTCAERRTGSLPSVEGRGELATLQRAVALSRATGAPVEVELSR
jgi:hypothetical protein